MADSAKHFLMPGSASMLRMRFVVPFFLDMQLQGGAGVHRRELLGLLHKALRGVMDKKTSPLRHSAPLPRSNPLAGTDATLLALAGTGYADGRSFGFASCERRAGAAEGVNLLMERRLRRCARGKAWQSVHSMHDSTPVQPCSDAAPACPHLLKRIPGAHVGRPALPLAVIASRVLGRASPDAVDGCSFQSMPQKRYVVGRAARYGWQHTSERARSLLLSTPASFQTGRGANVGKVVLAEPGGLLGP